MYYADETKPVLWKEERTIPFDGTLESLIPECFWIMASREGGKWVLYERSLAELGHRWYPCRDKDLPRLREHLESELDKRENMRASPSLRPGTQGSVRDSESQVEFHHHHLLGV